MVLDDMLEVLEDVGLGLLREIDKVVLLGQLDHGETVGGLEVALQIFGAVILELVDGEIV